MARGSSGVDHAALFSSGPIDYVVICGADYVDWDDEMLKRKQLALVLVLALLSASCTEKDLDRAAKASRDMAHSAVLVADGVGIAYMNGVMSLEKKNEMAEKLDLIQRNGSRFQAMLVDLDQKYPSGTLPPDIVTLLRTEFKTVSKPFYELWIELNVFGLGDTAKKLKENVEAIEKVLK